MKTYRVEITPAVKKHIKRIPKSDKIKILDAIESLGHNPRPTGYKKLVGYSKFFRFRVGDYRIIYQIFDLVLLVSVVEVANRCDALLTNSSLKLFVKVFSLSLKRHRQPVSQSNNSCFTSIAGFRREGIARINYKRS